MGFQFEQHRLGLWNLSWDLKKTICWEKGLGTPPPPPFRTLFTMWKKHMKSPGSSFLPYSLPSLWKFGKRISQLSPFDHATWQHPRERPQHVRGLARVYDVRMAQFVLKIEKVSHINGSVLILRLTVSVPDYGFWFTVPRRSRVLSSRYISVKKKKKKKKLTGTDYCLNCNRLITMGRNGASKTLSTGSPAPPSASLVEFLLLTPLAGRLFAILQTRVK